MVDKPEEYTIIVRGVKLTLCNYPFTLHVSKQFNATIPIADLLTVAAMKAYALGRRAKWKDYVDLFFVMKESYSVSEISSRAKRIFGKEFNEKIFRSGLAYFRDIDYSEEVEFMPGFSVSRSTIQKALRKFSVIEK